MDHISAEDSFLTDINNVEKQEVALESQFNKFVAGGATKNIASMWEQGGFYYSGSKYNNAKLIRLKSYVDKFVASVEMRKRRYQMYLFGWNASGTCVGFLKQDYTFTNDESQALFGHRVINFDILSTMYEGYKYKIVLAPTNDIEITPSDSYDAIKFFAIIPENGAVRTIPMITFIDDDGMAESLTIWENITDSSNFKCDLALITGKIGVEGGYASWSNVKRCANKGIEFISHTHNHINLNDPSLSQETVESDFNASINALRENYCESSFIVYPYTNISTDNIALVKKYFKGGFTLLNQPNNVMEPSRALIRRIDINESTKSEKVIDGVTRQVYLFKSLDTLKGIVDDAVRHNQWVVFMSHLRNSDVISGDGYYYDDDVKDLIILLAQYAMSKNVKVATVSEAYEIFKGLFY